jgi:hypothetical protein
VKRFVSLATGVLVAAIVWPSAVFAVTSSSSSYQVNESAFSSGSGIDSNSASYNARGSAGDLGVGEAGSASYNAFAGPISPSEEYLELNVTAGTTDLGTINTTTTGSGVSSFYVRTYINGGYVVKTMSNPPTNGSKTLTGMAALAASSQGTEQFGINLVANTSPIAQGTAPSKQPNSTFANGIAATGYDTTNQYKYVVGDTIAQSDTVGRAWGQTNYTISYIANASPVTVGGLFSMVHDIVCLPTY